MHIQAPQIHDIARRAKAAGKVDRARRAIGVEHARSCTRTSITSISARSATPPTGSSPGSMTTVRAPPAQVRFETAERLPLSDFPVPAYRPHQSRPLSARLAAILQRLPLSLRILRYPGALRPAAAPEDAGADRRRARRHAGAAATTRRRLFRRRQFHRQPQGGARDAAASIEWQKRRGYPLRFACEATLNIAKQTRNPRADAGGGIPHRVRRHRDPGGRSAHAHAQGAQRALPMLEAIRRSTATGSRSPPALFSASTPTPPRPRRGSRLSSTRRRYRSSPSICCRRCRGHRYGTASSAPAASSPTTPASKAMCGFCAPTTRWWRCGAAASRTPTRPSGCSSASPIRSKRPTPIGWSAPVRGKLTVNNLRLALVLAFNVALRIGIFSDYRPAVLEGRSCRRFAAARSTPR